jgi:hypothetical protein
MKEILALKLIVKNSERIRECVFTSLVLPNDFPINLIAEAALDCFFI